MPTIIHTSDLHLGAPLGWLGERAGAQRDRLRRALSAVVDVAIARSADCLLIAGDLFDSNNPPASDVRFALAEFERLAAGAGTPVAILPGSHDHLSTASVYASYRREFERAGEVAVLGLDGRPSFDLRSAGLSIRGNPPRAARSTAHQLASLVPDPAYTYNVAVAHGSVGVVPTAPDDHPIATAELSAPGWSYIALGHWHSWREVSSYPTPAVYAGAPEIVAVDQTGAGHVAGVELGPDGTRVEKIRVGTVSVVDVDVDATEITGVMSAADGVRADAPPDPNVIVRLGVSGLVPVDSGFDPEALRDNLAEDYLAVVVGPRRYHVRLDDADLAALPERLVIGRFARLMRERYEEASDGEEREEIEDAIQMGVALLQGKAVLG